MQYSTKVECTCHNLENHFVIADCSLTHLNTSPIPQLQYLHSSKNNSYQSLFVMRFYSPVNSMGSCRARSVYLTTRLLGRLSIVHILLPETDNCPSWISGRERMTVENISWSISTKECCRPRWGLNPRPPGLQLDHPSNWATEAGSYQCKSQLKDFSLSLKSDWFRRRCISATSLTL